ncbi:uncharacterized protein PV09_08580 [Verruconis gallopava]|uniref:Uncharacterized protein n=1 Tax=Verruconis gallopava TaxID=253628 RepID=A0A0D2A0C2_9PEZI|nr:uncharacterized protein PV09_08580 [Verruconis gallopava]KIV99774.1 hypothetical protein PV09_08580 [Verruconis gallopava]
MTRLDRITSPAESVGTHAVSNEDVGHGAAFAGRNDGFIRHSKLRIVKSERIAKPRKSNNGETSGSDGSAEDEADGDDDEADQNANDDEATEDDDAAVFAPSGTASLTRQDSNVSGMTDASCDTITSGQAGLTQLGGGLKRKRTSSELSVNTVLSTIERDDDEVEYPRKRVSRRLSNENGLLKYDSRIIDIDEDIDLAEYSKAIQSSSDDEDANYDGISQVDEEDESDVEKLEEAVIIQEETARMINATADSSVNGADSDIELPSDIDLGLFHSEMDDVFDAGESFFYRGLNSDPETPRRKRSDASARRVRFQDEIDIAPHSSQSTTSSETDIDIFPDLLENPFKPRDELPAEVRSHIEEEDDADVANGFSSDGEGSCWDFGEDKASENFFSWHDEAESDSEDDDSDSDLSGYDSDGDTTDDDLPPPSTIRAPKSLLHSRTPSTITSEITTPKPFPRNRRARRGPIMGSFIVDEKKAMAFIDPNTKQLRIQPARIPHVDPFYSTASSVNNSPQVNFSSMAYDSDNSDFPRLLTGPSDVMMSGVFGGLPGQRYEDGRFVMEANGPLLIGPPEAFYPFTSIRNDGTPEDDDDDYMTEEEFDDDVDLITAFLDVEGDEDEPEFAEDDITSPTTDAADETPLARRSILAHLDGGIVSSFRNHQDRHRHASKLPHDRNLDSTPIRDGRTADEVMTPLRKRKGSGGIHKSKPPRRMPLIGGFS